MVTRHWICNPARAPRFLFRWNAGFFERCATSNQQLRFDDVHGRDFFGNGVLHLNARVDLDEVKRAVVHVVEEFDRTRVLITGFLGQSNRSLAHALARFFIQPSGGPPFQRPFDFGAEPSNRARTDG